MYVCTEMELWSRLHARGLESVGSAVNKKKKQNVGLRVVEEGHIVRHE